MTPDSRWNPQTSHYAAYEDEFPFFLRATQHRYFLKLAIVTGINDANRLREVVKEGYENWVQWFKGLYFQRDFWLMMNMSKLDTLK